MANVRGNKIEKIVPSASWTEDSNTHYLLVDLPGFKKEQVQIRVLMSGHIKVGGQRETHPKKTVGFEQTYKIPGADNLDLNSIRAEFDGEILYILVPKKPQEVKKRDEEEEKKKKKNEDQKAEINNTQLQQKPDDQVVKNQEENNTQLQQKPANNDEVKNKELGGDDQINRSKIKEEKLLKKGNKSMRFFEEVVEKWEDDGDNCLRNTIKMLSQNRGIILTAVTAFSLGLLLSRRFQVGHG